MPGEISRSYDGPSDEVPVIPGCFFQDGRPRKDGKIMMADEEIERSRAELGSLIGPTKANWYAEACDACPSKDGLAATLWAIRYREMAMYAGRLEKQKKKAVAALRNGLVNDRAWSEAMIEAIVILEG